MIATASPDLLQSSSIGHQLTSFGHLLTTLGQALAQAPPAFQAIVAAISAHPQGSLVAGVIIVLVAGSVIRAVKPKKN